ncbi:MAG TPA: hypothetical protein P5025_09510 [Candidatus Ratteibacteria bacterium]|nr:hypothetical protein [Candidatus Ratteibacteria bacterium]
MNTQGNARSPFLQNFPSTESPRQLQVSFLYQSPFNPPLYKRGAGGDLMKSPLVLHLLKRGRIKEGICKGGKQKGDFEKGGNEWRDFEKRENYTTTH